MNTIKNDKTGQLKQNVRNMRSQATTTLHKWFHIGLYDNKFSSEVCVGGCDDTKQTIGGATIKTYKAGRTKLLARFDAAAASRTNDNYAYFATAMWMKNQFSTYPQYPRA